MVYFKNNFLKPTEELRNLQLLEEVSRDSTISQRKLSNSLGVALSVTNACLKKMIRKGYIKVKGINHKRISYYLTPEGFSEKTRLAYHFFQHTINFYVTLKQDINSKLYSIVKSGAKKVVFYGSGDVMEVALICLSQTNLYLAGIVDDSDKKHGKKIFGYYINKYESIKDLNPDAIFVTSLKYKEKMLEKLKQDKTLENIQLYSL